MTSSDRTRSRLQGDDVPDPSQAIPSNPPPTYDETTSNERPPAYDGIRLPPYAEAMLLGRHRPSTRYLLHQINLRAYMVRRETSAIIDRIRDLQSNFPPRSHIFRRLDDSVLDLRALYDMAYLRQTCARISYLRMEEYVILLRCRQQHPQRNTIIRSILGFQNEIADLHRDVMAAPDGDEHFQIWRDGLAATQKSLNPDEGIIPVMLDQN